MNASILHILTRSPSYPPTRLPAIPIYATILPSVPREAR